MNLNTGLVRLTIMGLGTIITNTSTVITPPIPALKP